MKSVRPEDDIHSWLTGLWLFKRGQQHRRTHRKTCHHRPQNWMFAGSEDGAKAMAIAYTLIETVKLKPADPQAWLTWDLVQIADHKINRLDRLTP